MLIHRKDAENAEELYFSFVAEMAAIENLQPLRGGDVHTIRKYGGIRESIQYYFARKAVVGHFLAERQQTLRK